MYVRDTACSGQARLHYNTTLSKAFFIRMLQVQCKVGDKVTKGQVLVVLEAMKMEYPIAAPADGQVHT